MPDRAGSASSEFLNSWLWSNCWIFKAGHQIGLDITSSSSFMYLPNPNTGLPLEPDGIWPSGGQPYKGRNVTAHNKIIYGASRVTLPTVDVADLPPFMRFSASGAEDDLTRTLREVEQDYAQRVLESVDGNKTRAAQILGIDRKTLRAKLNPSE